MLPIRPDADKCELHQFKANIMRTWTHLLSWVPVNADPMGSEFNDEVGTLIGSDQSVIEAARAIKTEMDRIDQYHAAKSREAKINLLEAMSKLYRV